MANITVNRKSGFIRRGGVMRRETAWVALTPTNTNLAGASISVLFTGYSAAVLALRPFTIVRTRGYLHCRSDQAGATEFFDAVLAMAIVSDQALAIGVTAVPTPDTDRDSDLFFLFEEIAGTIQQITSVGVLENQLGRTFDSKAMRKVEDGQDIAVTIETAAASLGVNFSKGGRQLIKLH